MRAASGRIRSRPEIETAKSTVERAGVVQHHIVEVLEHIVDGAGRVLDAPSDLTRGQAGKPLVLDNVLRSIEN